VSARWHRIFEDFAAFGVDRRTVTQVGGKDPDVNDIVECRSGRLQRGLEVR